MSNTLAAQSAITALKMALKQRRYPSEELIHHSDRDLQYCSEGYQEVLSKNSVKCSMTEQYDPYENAVAERVNGILKQEFINGIDAKYCKLITLLIKQSVLIYNENRPHSSCFHTIPKSVFHDKQHIKIQTANLFELIPHQIFNFEYHLEQNSPMKRSLPLQYI